MKHSYSFVVSHSGVSLDPKLYFNISFAAGDVDAGNMFTITQVDTPETE